MTAVPFAVHRSPSAVLVPSTRLADARGHIEAARSGDADHERHRAEMLAFVEAHPDALERTCETGHLTGSAMVIDPSDRRFLLMLHAKLGRWFQPGGHADGDANLPGVAWREDGRVLILGAGGGLELKVFAAAQPGWRFDGVDPSAEMLRLAATTLGPLADRAALHEGYVDTAPAGPFDAATCLLTLHFVAPEERRHTLRELRRRLRPGAPLVVAHHSVPQDETQRRLWLSRYAAFAVASGVAPEQAERAYEAIGRQLPVLAPEEDEALLREAGFTDVGLFYAGFTFRGWVAYA